MAVKFGAADRFLFGTLAVGSVVAVASLWEDDDNSLYYTSIAIACSATLYIAVYGAQLGSWRVVSLSDMGAKSKGYIVSGNASTLSAGQLRVMSVGSALAAFLFVLQVSGEDAPWLRYSAYAIAVAVATRMTGS